MERFEKWDYMLKRCGKNKLVKLEADIFYKLLKYKLYKGKQKNDRVGIYFRGRRNFKNLARYIMKAKKGQIIDHINRDDMDNRRKNLRIVTAFQNCINTSRNLNGLYGLAYHKRDNRVLSKIRIKGKTLLFSCKKTIPGILLCALARDKFILQAGVEDYAPMNFPFFRIKKYKDVLLKTDLKLLRRIYCGRKNCKN